MNNLPALVRKPGILWLTPMLFKYDVDEDKDKDEGEEEEKKELERSEEVRTRVWRTILAESISFTVGRDERGRREKAEGRESARC